MKMDYKINIASACLADIIAKRQVAEPEQGLNAVRPADWAYKIRLCRLLKEYF
jgi:hypothetical protein